MTSPRHRFSSRVQRAGLILAAASCSALAFAPSAQAAPVRILGSAQNVARGSFVFLDVKVPARSRCRLQAGAPPTAVASRVRRMPATRVRFSWQVPEAAVGGTVEVTVKCKRANGKFRAKWTAVTTIGIVAEAGGTTGILPANGVRVRSLARRPADRHDRRGRPSNPGHSAFSLQLTRGTGGAGFGTFWPLSTGTRAPITQGPNGGDSHYTTTTRYAVDLGVDEGTEIRAGFNGVVVKAIGDCRTGVARCGDGFGNHVLLKGADGTCALHAHLSRTDVQVGQQVAKYVLLGLSGWTGHVLPASPAGAHLHFDHVDCGTYKSLPWTPAEGGPLTPGYVTSENAPDPVGCAGIQGSCVNPQGGVVNPQSGVVNPQQPPPDPGTGTGGQTPQPPTYAQTTGGVTNTWTDPKTAGGQPGPQIPANKTVQIACKLGGFKVASGNTWWYRIAEWPWNNAFYASADAFYNNGQTTGDLKGTPFVDAAVRDC